MFFVFILLKYFVFVSLKLNIYTKKKKKLIKLITKLELKIAGIKER